MDYCLRLFRFLLGVSLVLVCLILLSFPSILIMWVFMYSRAPSPSQVMCPVESQVAPTTEYEQPTPKTLPPAPVESGSTVPELHRPPTPATGSPNLRQPASVTGTTCVGRSRRARRRSVGCCVRCSLMTRRRCFVRNSVRRRIITAVWRRSLTRPASALIR